ncbi:MAG: MFS transporter [Flavobacteriales bacterium]|nr:MFS transporter [Flavobacteriales bacterium]
MKNLKILPAYLLTFVNVIGFSIMIPVLPFIVKEANAPEYVYGLLLSAYSFFQFIGSPFLGKLSDSRGRKPILVISQFGTLLSWVIYGVAYFVAYDVLEVYQYDFMGKVFFYSLPLIIIAFARIADGLTGGNISVTNAYISDITTLEQKKTIFGTLGGIVGIGFVIGPAIGGLTSGYNENGEFEYLGTILTAAGVSLIALLSILFFLKESLPIEKRREYKKHNFIKSFNIVKRVNSLNPKYIVKQVLVLKSLMSATMAFYIATIVLYVIELFDFTPFGTGIFLLVAGIFLGFNQAVLFKKVVLKIGELYTLIIGFSLTALGLVLITLTDILWIYMILYYILNLGLSLSFPVFNSLISQHADEDKQGEIMGISESIQSISNAIFPVIATAIYGFIGYNIYFFLALIPLAGSFVTMRLIKKLKANDN